MRVVQVSDSHLSPRAPHAQTNWDAVVAYVEATRPDLVVHTGDLTLDGVLDPSELELAREQLDRLAVPWLAVPGNHDVGDPDDERRPLTDERRRRFADTLGTGSWAVDLGGWRLVGVDGQTLSHAGDPAAERLWRWLTTAVAAPVPTALFLHRPVGPLADGERQHATYYLTQPARFRIEALIAEHGVRLVASGHRHLWRSVEHRGVAHVWAPPTWAVLPDSAQPLIGTKVAGVAHHCLDEDGVVASSLVQPPGIRTVVHGVDFPSPYPERARTEPAAAD